MPSAGSLPDATPPELASQSQRPELAVLTEGLHPAHRAVLSWIGGGLVVICGGLWTLITFFHKSATAPDGRSGSRTTTNGLSGWPLVALVGALAGALVLVVALNGPRVTVTEGSVAVGGDVTNSSITTNR